MLGAVRTNMHRLVGTATVCMACGLGEQGVLTHGVNVGGLRAGGAGLNVYGHGRLYVWLGVHEPEARHGLSSPCTTWPGRSCAA